MALLTTVYNHLVRYMTPMSLNWSWSWGSLSGLFIVVQVLTGVWLGMHYNVVCPFEAVQSIMHDIPGGM